MMMFCYDAIRLYPAEQKLMYVGFWVGDYAFLFAGYRTAYSLY
jgi:hypothetical protein